MHSIRATLTLCLLATLAACSSLPTQAPTSTAASLSLHQQHLASLSRIQRFELKGRLGVQADGKGYSASLIWQHNAEQDDIRIYSPLGGQLARIQKTADGIRLEDAQGQVSVGRDAESLTQTLLGWRLPLTGLADWALGRPANSAMARARLENSRRNERKPLLSPRTQNLSQDGYGSLAHTGAWQDGFMTPLSRGVPQGSGQSRDLYWGFLGTRVPAGPSCTRVLGFYAVLPGYAAGSRKPGGRKTHPERLDAH